MTGQHVNGGVKSPNDFCSFSEQKICYISFLNHNAKGVPFSAKSAVKVATDS